MGDVIKIPFDRDHEFLAYALMGFKFEEIAEMFGTSPKVVQRLAENLANKIQKERFEKHLAKVETVKAGEPEPPGGGAA